MFDEEWDTDYAQTEVDKWGDLKKDTQTNYYPRSSKKGYRKVTDFDKLFGIKS